MVRVEVLQADITTLDVDAIANAANTELAHGGGVAGAIARAGGPEVQRESDRRAPIGLGEAVETTAGGMPSRWVIHAATMRLGGPTSADIIRRATAATLARADQLGARSLALVAFGTGVRGFPLDEAARVEAEEGPRRLPAGRGAPDRGGGGPPPPGGWQRARADRLRRPRRGRTERVRTRSATEWLEQPPTSCKLSQCATNGRSMSSP